MTWAVCGACGHHVEAHDSYGCETAMSCTGLLYHCTCSVFREGGVSVLDGPRPVRVHGLEEL